MITGGARNGNLGKAGGARGRRPANGKAQGGVKKKVVVISMMALAVMNVTTVMSLRGLPSQAVYGLSSIFYYVIAAVVLLIPPPRGRGTRIDVPEKGASFAG